MKTTFIKYCLSFVVLFFTTFTCFAHQLEIKQVGDKRNITEKGFGYEIKEQSSTIALKRVEDKGFHKETINHTVVNHLKGSFTETQFEAQNTLTLKKAKALFKFEVLRFARILSGKDFNEQALVPFEYSRFNTFLHSALYLRLQVIRL